MSSSAVLSNLSISVDDLLRVQGANPETIRSRRPSIIEMAEKAIQTGSRLIQPAVWMKTLQVQGFRHNTILLENGQQLSGELIAQKLAGARKVAFAIGTLGKALEDEIHTTMANDPASGYMLDSYGSACADALGEWAMAQVRAAADAEGLSTSMALMPGYAAWPVDMGQPQIFAAVQPDASIVRLTDSAQIIPRKSFSFIIGLGCAQDDSSPCELCDLSATCPLRH